MYIVYLVALGCAHHCLLDELSLPRMTSSLRRAHKMVTRYQSDPWGLRTGRGILSKVDAEDISKLLYHSLGNMQSIRWHISYLGLLNGFSSSSLYIHFSIYSDICTCLIWLLHSNSNAQSILLQWFKLIITAHFNAEIEIQNHDSF